MWQKFERDREASSKTSWSVACIFCYCEQVQARRRAHRYQYQKFNNCSEAKTFFSSKYTEHCHSLSKCMKSRLYWSDLQLIWDIIFMLSSHGWEKVVQEDDLSAIDRLKELEQLSRWLRWNLVWWLSMQSTILSLTYIDYHCVWWRLFHALNATEWSSVLALDELLFSLPAQMENLNRCSLHLAQLNVDKRSCLGNQTLDDILFLKDEELKYLLQMWASTFGGYQSCEDPLRNRETNTHHVQVLIYRLLK